MKTPAESYQRQCDWSEGWDAAQLHFEERLDTMAEEFEDLLKSSVRDAAVQATQIERLNRELLARGAERDFAEKQLDRIRRALA